MKTLAWAIPALAAGLLLSALPTRAEEIVSVDISGRWRINDELSDNPREVMQKKMDEMRASRGGRSEGWRGGGGPGGGFGGGRRGGGGNGPSGGGRRGGETGA